MVWARVKAVRIFAASIIRPYGRALAGSAITTHFDPESRVFELSFTSSQPGISEITVPARAYPKGYSIALEGACYEAKGETLALSADAKVVKLRLAPKAP